MENYSPSLAALASFAEAFGVVMIPTDQPEAVITTDGVVSYVFIPASATPVEQGRQLAAFLKGAFSLRSVA